MFNRFFSQFCGKFLLSALFVLLTSSFSQDQISLLIGDIKNCPSVYYSQEAMLYYQSIGQTVVSGNKDDALRGYRAAIKLADMSSNAFAAVPVLIDQFPKAIHISEIKNARYAGEGTFEDWVSTYIMNEKNKFMLASPFIDYNGISQCDQYIEAIPQTKILEQTPLSGTAIKTATVNITITFTCYFASCALSRISGMTIGNSQNDWRIWWAQNGNTGIDASSSFSATPKAIVSGQHFEEIIVKGKYRMSLTTGDELIGFVESKDDTSLIFETTDGKPYVFSRKLIDRCDLIDLPKSLLKKPEPKQTPVQKDDMTVISYDNLLLKNHPKASLEVKISNGSLFKGSLESIDQTILKINIEGTIIPMQREVITQIVLITPQKKIIDIPAGPFDTIIKKSSVVDDWGRPAADIIVSGTIKKEENAGVNISSNGVTQFIKQTDIVRVIRHTQDNSNDQIIRYAKPLNCPQGMVLIDLPPGFQGRPFFKTCIDKYEYPNHQGSVPQVNISFMEAQKLCEQQGKRLCTAEEWQWACSGLDALPYPYGKTSDENKCNSDASRAIEVSGARINCFSKFGAFDMAGNVFEWVRTSNNQPALMGGPYSKCQTVSPGVSGDAKPINGLRCCKSN